MSAALGDWCVESASNAGIFGGAYHDNDHAGVLPALFAGLIVACEICAVRAVTLRRQGSRFVDAARSLSTRVRGGDYAIVYLLQIGAVFAIESAEQLLSGGGPVPHGLTWLGAPVVASLTVHALICWCCVRALRTLVKAALTAFASIANITGFTLISRECAPSSAYVRRRREPPLRNAPPAVACHAGGRAPPLLPQTA